MKSKGGAEVQSDLAFTHSGPGSQEQHKITSTIEYLDESIYKDEEGLI
jgi:hypothetical protein